jgi:tetratricopeptide (TPR) repeat protein
LGREIDRKPRAIPVDIHRIRSGASRSAGARQSEQMPLRGELDSVDLAHVFQMLALNEKAGTLAIVHEGVQRRLYFAGDSVWIPVERELVTSRAIRALLREGRLRQDQVDRARANAAVRDADDLDLLVEMAVLSADDRDRALRAQHEEEVYELFFLRGAQFEFRDSEAPAEGEIEPRLALSAGSVIIEAARRVDEWKYIQEIVHSGADIFEAGHELDGFTAREMSPDLKAVHAALDGVTTVDGVIAITGITRFLVFRNLALLLERHAASPVPADDLITRGRERLAAGDRRAALACFEQAIDRGADDVAVFIAAGECREAGSEPALAARWYTAAARLAEDRGDIDSAVKLYLKVRAALPTDIAARERLFVMRRVVAAHVSRAEYDPEAEGFELARIQSELGRREDLRETLAGLLDHAGSDPRRLECVAELAGSLGQPAFGVDALLLAAAHYRTAGRHDEALAVLTAARRIDPMREDVASLATATKSSLETKRGRRRTTLRSFAIVVGSALIAVFYGKYSNAALNAYGRYSIEDFIAAADFVEGRTHFEAIRSRYPLTVPSLLAGEKLRELEIHERHFREIDEFRRQVQGERRETNLKQAEGLHRAAVDARRSGDYRKALELLRRAQSYSGESDPLALGAAIEELETYLAAAARLRSEATFFRNAGRIAEAHERLERLVDQYPRSPDASSVLLPVRIETVPAGARIRVDDAPVRIGDEKFTVEAETPFVVDLPSDRAVEIALVLDGYAPYETPFDARSGERLTVTLPQRPQLEAILPRAASDELVLDGDTVYAALESGRVAALDAATLAVRWQTELPDLAEAVAAPLVLEAVLLVPTSTSRLIALDRATGATLGSCELPGRPVASPIRAGRDAIAVRLQLGRLALGTLGPGNVPAGFESLTLPCVIAAGPVPLPADRIAFVGTDGKAWVRAVDGSLSLLRGEGVPGRATAIAWTGRTLWIGEDGGRLRGYDATSRDERCSIQALPGRAIERIVPDDAWPLVVGGDRSVVIDCAAGNSVGALDARAKVLAADHESIAALYDDGTLRVLDRATLAARASFSCEEALRLAGAMREGRGYFPGVEGRIFGIRP